MEEALYHELRNSEAEDCSKLQGKAVPDYEVKIVRLICHQEVSGNPS